MLSIIRKTILKVRQKGESSSVDNAQIQRIISDSRMHRNKHPITNRLEKPLQKVLERLN